MQDRPSVSNEVHNYSTAVLSSPTSEPAISVVSAQLLTQQVANHIRDLIVHDVLKPGERIREQLISERFGISRTPVREALQTLGTQRLVDILPNRGAVAVQPSNDEIRAMLTVYSTLERLGAELACQMASATDIAGVRMQLELMEAALAAGDRAAYFKANQKFHLGILSASGNSTLVEMHSHLNMRLYRVRYLAVIQDKDWRSASKEHKSILKALVEHNGARLGNLLQNHLGFAWRRLDDPEQPVARN